MSTAFPPVPQVTGIAAPLLLDNVDTDAIIPSREIRGVTKTGLADGLFAGWRYVAPGSRDPDPAFILNDPAYAHATILLGGSNFGCGSSREHAVWALHEYGFRAVIAPSFAPIFRGNCIVNGIIPVALAPETIAALASAPQPVTVDLATLSVTSGSLEASFTLDNEERLMLSEGLDPIDLTLRKGADIRAFQQADAVARPWIYLKGAA